MSRLELLEHRLLLAVGANIPNSTLADLPTNAQSAIGQDQSAYHAASGTAGVSLANLANRFTTQVQSGTLHVPAGLDTWDMLLRGVGYDGAVQPVGTSRISVTGNRLGCNYGTVDEWYVNGPGGLEQGFTVALLQWVAAWVARPDGHGERGGSLTAASGTGSTNS
jgi:hypothetical protein